MYRRSVFKRKKEVKMCKRKETSSAKMKPEGRSRRQNMDYKTPVSMLKRGHEIGFKIPSSYIHLLRPP